MAAVHQCAVHQCTVIASKLRSARTPLDVRQKPDRAPQFLITPANVKRILKEGPIEQLFLCPCHNCESFSGCSAPDRRKYYREAELADKYAIIWALLITLNYSGLIYEFQKNEITLHQRLHEGHLRFLNTLISGDIANDVIERILNDQFKFFARPFEIRDVERRIPEDEALAIEEDKEPVGQGDSGEVFAFRILEEYKGEGFRDFKPTNGKFARKIFQPKKQTSGCDEWCKSVQIHNLLEKPHPHIVAILAAFHYGVTFSIIFPLAECSLEEYFQEKTPYKPDFIWTQMQGVAQGLAFLHGLRNGEDGKNKKQKGKEDFIIIAYHLDLKPANILIMRGGANKEDVTFQIADFGLSTIKNRILSEKSVSDSGDAGNQGGYTTYAPPEQQRSGAKHYAGHDLWSLSAIFSEVATHDIRPRGEAKSSLRKYRTDRTMDREVAHWGSTSFYNGDKLKESVNSQHRDLLKCVQDQHLEEPGYDVYSWQRYFYQEPFFKLITQMLNTEPTRRGTAIDVADALQELLEETKRQQHDARAHVRVDFRPEPMLQNIWEEARTGKLQKSYSIPLDTYYVRAYCQVPTSDNPMKCVAFFSDDDDLQIIRYFNPDSADKTDKNIKIQRHRQSEVTGMMPFYATKPTRAIDQSLGSHEISICETRRNEIFSFISLEDAYDFQRFLIKQYPQSKFYAVSRVALKGKRFHRSSPPMEGKLYLQLWCNHDLSGSRKPYEHYEPIVWNEFLLPNETDSSETNSVKLRPNHGALNRLDIVRPEMKEEHYIPLSDEDPKGYDKRYKSADVTFENLSGSVHKTQE
ncbi:hypothetical protein MMC22_011077 [Lobaria immixta]|nr:hypothetical protein [Lobaria immixta]